LWLKKLGLEILVQIDFLGLVNDFGASEKRLFRRLRGFSTASTPELNRARYERRLERFVGHDLGYAPLPHATSNPALP